MNCTICNATCARTSSCIVCATCGQKVHYKCATTINADFTPETLDMIKNSEGAIIFRCGKCMKLPNNRDDITSKIDKLEATVSKLSDVITQTVLSDLNHIKDELVQCLANAKDSEIMFKEKLQELKLDNESIRRQLYRSDIIIKGLDSKLISSTEDLYSTIFKIGSLLEIELGHNDINLCTYIHNKNSVLVKLNSVYKRDQLMKNYFAVQSLTLNQLCKTKAESRVYLNDHLAPIAFKLNYMCRKLLKAHKIKKFRILKKNMPEAKVTLNTGGEKIINFEAICAMMKTIEDICSAANIES